MTHATKNLMLSLAIVYGLGTIGLYLRAPEHIQRMLAVPKRSELSNQTIGAINQTIGPINPNDRTSKPK